MKPQIDMRSASCLFALLSCLAGKAWAQTSNATGDQFVHHVIVILDRSGSMTEGRDARQNALRNLIANDLTTVAFDADALLPGRVLLDPNRGDYLSIVSFGLEEQNPDFNEFIETRDNGISFGYIYNQNINRSAFQTLWEIIDANYWPEFYSKRYTVLSVALPLSVHALRRPEPLVNRTFLLLVTDYKFSGEGDAVHELNQIIKQVRPANSEQVFQKYDAVRSGYLWRELDIRRQGGTRGVQLRAYELEALVSRFAIEALVDHQKAMTFERVPNGYEVNFNIAPEQNLVSDFSVEKVEATLLVDSTTIIAQDTLLSLNAAGTLPFFIERDLYGQPLAVKMRYWVHAKDNAYGAHVLHPAGSARQGSEGLNRILPVDFNGPGRIWFVMPMTDSLYDVAATIGLESRLWALIFWHIVFGGAAFVLFLVLLQWITTMRDPKLIVYR